MQKIGIRTKDEVKHGAKCGMVRQDYEIDYGKDWRVFSDGEGASQERTGMPSTNLLHDKGLTTDIGWENKDYAGGRISGEAPSV